jgi:calcineurin-like phosphoesterase family protein
MSNTFFIGDTHFGHKGIITFEATKVFRPFATIEQHDEELVKRWNSVVRKQDLVWHLGDFCFGSRNLAIAGRLNGRKKLVMGNHDTYPTAKYLKYFEKLYGAIGMGEDFILTHIPVHKGQFERWRYNIHGHTHTDTLPDKRYICVSAEQINLTPVSIEELKDNINRYGANANDLF